VSTSKSFTETVYEVVYRIPAGKVSTYGQVAALAGNSRASRAVGTALRHSPPGLPYHRVVSGDGRIASESGGLQRRTLLGAEGVTFTPDGRVDLRKHIWDESR